MYQLLTTGGQSVHELNSEYHYSYKDFAICRADARKAARELQAECWVEAQTEPNFGETLSAEILRAHADGSLHGLAARGNLYDWRGSQGPLTGAAQSIEASYTILPGDVALRDKLVWKLWSLCDVAASGLVRFRLRLDTTNIGVWVFSNLGVQNKTGYVHGEVYVVGAGAQGLIDVQGFGLLEGGPVGGTNNLATFSVDWTVPHSLNMTVQTQGTSQTTIKTVDLEKH